MNHADAMCVADLRHCMLHVWCLMRYGKMLTASWTSSDTRCCTIPGVPFAQSLAAPASAMMKACIEDASVQERLQEVAAELGERVIAHERNPISFALTLDQMSSRKSASASEPDVTGKAGPASEARFAEPATEDQDAGCSQEEQRRVTRLGAMLWQRRVSGVRVVPRGVRQTVAGVAFEGYGSSCADYPHHYLTAAAALGGTEREVDIFVSKLRAAYRTCAQDANCD